MGVDGPRAGLRVNRPRAGMGVDGPRAWLRVNGPRAGVGVDRLRAGVGVDRLRAGVGVDGLGAGTAMFVMTLVMLVMMVRTTARVSLIALIVSLQNQADVHVADRAWPADNLDRLSLRRSEPAKRHNDDRTPAEAESLHGFPLPSRRAEPGAGAPPPRPLLSQC
jgi:hypothetical protein